MLASSGERMPPCGGAGLGAPDLSGLGEDAGDQERFDQAEDALVCDASAHSVHEGRVVDLIEAGGDVAFHDPLV